MRNSSRYFAIEIVVNATYILVVLRIARQIELYTIKNIVSSILYAKPHFLL
jgi:hypothetical protein